MRIIKQYAKSQPRCHVDSLKGLKLYCLTGLRALDYHLPHYGQIRG